MAQATTKLSQIAKSCFYEALTARWTRVRNSTRTFHEIYTTFEYVLIINVTSTDPGILDG